MHEKNLLNSEWVNHEKREVEYPIPVIRCTPALTRDQFLALSEDVEAVVVIAFATGTVPDWIVSAIKKRIDEGVAVVALTGNPGDKHGLLRIAYDAGGEAYKSGMVGLQKVNVNHLQEVVEALTSALKDGLKGADLAKEMKERYAYREGEEKPHPKWER